MTREEAIEKHGSLICGTEEEIMEAIREKERQEPCDDAISREELLKAIETWDKFGVDDTNSLFRLDNLSLPHYVPYIHYDDVIKCIKGMPSVTQKSVKWIPVSERLPDNTDPVIITWVNHDPESYYADIKDKPFTATGHYCNGRWWWYSVTSQDYLDEYGHWDIAAMDDAIEVIAWMPLPKPYEPQERSDKE